MAFLNDHYFKLKAGYLFPEIARRVRAFTEERPDLAKSLIRCGIGDVTEPLPPSAISAMHKAVDDLGRRETFRGYGPEQGYEFLRNAIAETFWIYLGARTVWRLSTLFIPCMSIQTSWPVTPAPRIRVARIKDYFTCLAPG